MRAETAAVLSLLGMACAGPPPVACSDFAVEDLSIRGPGGSIAVATSGGTSIPLTVSARVPCLQGGARAAVTTSSGTVDGQGPGSAANVFLSPISALDGDDVEAFATLIVEVPRDVRVNAQVGNRVACTLFVVQSDGGTPTSFLETPCGTP
jgi:hypothetical protein